MALICALDEPWSLVRSKARPYRVWYGDNTKIGGVLANTCSTHWRHHLYGYFLGQSASGDFSAVSRASFQVTVMM
ncbi:MAG: hypothetical protein G5701_02955 [Serratia symbiotica]|nr:hypothetical protein [Serratia symbiotica]